MSLSYGINHHAICFHGAVLVKNESNENAGLCATNLFVGDSAQLKIISMESNQARHAAQLAATPISPLHCYPEETPPSKTSRQEGVEQDSSLPKN